MTVSIERMLTQFPIYLALLVGGPHTDGATASSQQVAASPTAQDVAKKVQSFYAKTKSFKSGFTQETTNKTFNKLKPVQSSGKVYILKPGKMRWDYKKSPANSTTTKSFISDGKHLWAVMHKNKQYYKQSLAGSTLPVALSFLLGTGSLQRDFNIKLGVPGTHGSSKSDLLLQLTPKKPSARYKRLWLVIDKSNFSVKRSVVLNSKGDTNSIRFSTPKIDDGSVKSSFFVFNAKANKSYRLITPPKPSKRATP